MIRDVRMAVISLQGVVPNVRTAQMASVMQAEVARTDANKAGVEVNVPSLIMMRNWLRI